MEKIIITHQEAIIIALQGIRELNESKSGEFETLPRKMANNPLTDIRAVVDENVKKKVRLLNYEYIPTLSSAEMLYFLDTIPLKKVYSNCIDILKPAYDYDKKQVVWVSIKDM